MKPECSVEGCEKRSLFRGLCSAHYQRFRRSGSTDRKRAEKGLAKRFLYETAVNYSGDDCLAWPFETIKGRGKVNVKGRSSIAARVVCETVHGLPSSDNLDAAHSCGNKICVNPKHLSWKTRKENEADKEIHGTRLFGEKAPGAKLTEESVLKILGLKGEKTGKEVGRIFAVDSMTIYNIWAGKRWVHLSKTGP